MLFAARAGQGLGAAMLSPAALSIITAPFHGPERAKALGVWGAVGGAGAAIGVLLGGVLTELVDWRAIFFINLPVGARASPPRATHLLPADAARPQWRGLDLRGALLATAGLGALVYALSQAQSSGWTSTQTLGIGAAALAGLAAFAALELRTAQPLLRVQRLRDRAVGGGFVMMLAASAVLFGSFLLSSLYLQNVLGTGALETGLAFLPFAVAIGAGVHAAGHLITHAGVRIPLAAGFAIAAAGMLLLSGAGADGSYAADVLPGMLVAGIGLGIVLVSVSVAVLTGAADHETGMLSGPEHHRPRDRRLARHRDPRHDRRRRRRPDRRGRPGRRHRRRVPRRRRHRRRRERAALVLLPSARTFLPKLALAPRVAVH